MKLSLAGALVLLVAGVLEVGGDAAIRHGLVRQVWPWTVGGAVALVAYGLVVNLNRTIDFGQLMGLYIVAFFVVSQIIAVVALGERPGLGLLVGGALIVAGGLVIQVAAS
jgi:small multidrug resistance family-3 protein